MRLSSSQCLPVQPLPFSPSRILRNGGAWYFPFFLLRSPSPPGERPGPEGNGLAISSPETEGAITAGGGHAEGSEESDWIISKEETLLE